MTVIPRPLAFQPSRTSAQRATAVERLQVRQRTCRRQAEQTRRMRSPGEFPRRGCTASAKRNQKACGKSGLASIRVVPGFVAADVIRVSYQPAVCS